MVVVEVVAASFSVTLKSRPFVTKKNWGSKATENSRKQTKQSDTLTLWAYTGNIRSQKH